MAEVEGASVRTDALVAVDRALWVVAGDLAERIAARSRRFGHLRWSEFMDAALYDPDDGFYEAGGRAGRRGDFVTSPELGPLFATVVARAVDQCWDELHRPDPFVVVEAAAGVGTLARDVLRAQPACAGALRYVLVERSSALRAEHAQHVPLENPASVLGPITPERDDDEEAQVVAGAGPLVTSLAELPALPVTGMVLANELLDNLPCDLLEWRGGRWHEVTVATPEAPEDPANLVELLVPASADRVAVARRLVGDPAILPDGARIPIQLAARNWVGQACSLLQAGRLIVFDYADDTRCLAETPPGRWLRTFSQHDAAPLPALSNPGGQDITCVVARDQLLAPDADRSQAEWLRSFGLDDLVTVARQEWQARAAIGDLAAIRARSRVLEAQALTDPAGLGAHRVLEWVANRR